MEKERLLTIWDEAIPPERIPQYPTYKLLVAKEGDKTFDIDPKCKAEFGDGSRVDTVERDAIPGEILLDAELRHRLDVRDNLVHRGLVMAKCAENERERAIQKIYCKSNILYFFNTFLWIQTPGKPPEPFVTFSKQDQLIMWVLWAYKFRRKILLEKSRKVGATWIMRGIHAWFAMLFENYIGFSMSLSKKEVDTMSINSLLGKQRFMLENLPEWMRGGWTRWDKITDKMLYIEIPDNKSVLEGILTGSSAGRSGRANWIDYDEFAHVERDVETLDASTQLADSELYLSTVVGLDNEFARMANDPATIKMRFHWTENPMLNEKWAILARSDSKMTEDRWNQEMEIQYESSAKGRVYKNFRSFGDPDGSRWYHVRTEEYFEFDPAYPVDCGIDFGIGAGSPNAVVYIQVKPMIPHFPNSFGDIVIPIDEHEEEGQILEELIFMIKERMSRYNQNPLKRPNYIADWNSALAKNFDGVDRIQRFAENGIILQGQWCDDTKGPIDCVKARLEAQGAFAINPTLTPKLITAMQQWAYPTDPKTGLVIPGSKPKHKHSNLNTALYYWMTWKAGYKRANKKQRETKWETRIIRRAAV